MNDLERELRTLLEEKAAGVGVPPPDARLLARARRRQLRTVLGGIALVAAAASGAVLALSALRSGIGSTPAGTAELTDTTVNGITITHPERWYVVDPVQAGIAPPSEDLPRLVLFVSDADPVASGTLGCPALAEGAAQGFELTVREMPLALAGEAARPWPVPMERLDIDTSESACYPGWTILGASWTAARRSFEARLGIGPDVPEEERAAIESAFMSLRFAPTGADPEAVVLATGTVAGEAWTLIAERRPGGMGLRLQSASWSGGGGGFEDRPLPLHTIFHVFGTGDEREVLVFGAVREPGVRVEAFPLLGGPSVSTSVIDVPDDIGGDYDAFVLVYRPDLPTLGVDLNVYDAQGRTLTTVGIRVRPDLEIEDAGPTASPSPEEVLFRGRLNECFWTLERWTVGPGHQRLALVSRDGELLVELMVETGPGAPPLQLASFDCPTDASEAVLVFGATTAEVAGIAFTSPGPGAGAGGPPECLASTLREPLCFVLWDLNAPGEAIALDARGKEIARVAYG